MTQETRPLYGCPRCGTNIGIPEEELEVDFFGCARGSCEAEQIGTVTITTEAKLTK